MGHDPADFGSHLRQAGQRGQGALKSEQRGDEDRVLGQEGTVGVDGAGVVPAPFEVEGSRRQGPLRGGLGRDQLDGSDREADSHEQGEGPHGLPPVNRRK